MATYIYNYNKLKSYKYPSNWINRLATGNHNTCSKRICINDDFCRDNKKIDFYFLADGAKVNLVMKIFLLSLIFTINNLS